MNVKTRVELDLERAVSHAYCNNLSTNEIKIIVSKLLDDLDNEYVKSLAAIKKFKKLKK